MTIMDLQKKKEDLLQEKESLERQIKVFNKWVKDINADVRKLDRIMESAKGLFEDDIPATVKWGNYNIDTKEAVKTDELPADAVEELKNNRGNNKP